MKKNIYLLWCRAIVVLLFALPFNNSFAGKKDAREYYQLTVYHFKNAEQEKVLDNYLQNALLPVLHKLNISKAGVFKALANDTATDKLLYVFITIKSVEDADKIKNKLNEDAAYQSAGKEYIDAVYNTAPYTRMETIILHAFPLAPKMQVPQLTSANKERVYELRSYESATEKIFQNKVKMFNEGGEIDFFKRLGFNAVFYSEVVAGSKMPNLMYMTTFENMQSRDAHWKSFVDDPFWKKLSAMPEYQNNVQHIDITFLRPTDYSDF